MVERCPNLNFRPIGDVVLKGKTESLALYSPVSDAEAQSALHQAYLRAYELLQAGNPEAAACFAQLARHYPDDPLVRFHHQRVAAGLLTSHVVMEDK